MWATKVTNAYLHNSTSMGIVATAGNDDGLGAMVFQEFSAQDETI